MNKNDFVISYLSRVIGESRTGYGADDEKISKRKEAELCEDFERYVCGVDGDEGCDFFKIAEGDVPFVYNGVSYERSDDVNMRYIVKKSMERMEIGIVYRNNSHAKIAESCMDALMSEARCKFDPDRNYVIFPNGVLCLKEGKFVEHSIKYKSDVVLDFLYKSGARLDLWDKIIVDTIPDEGMRNAFQQFCGGFLANREEYKIEYICLLVGTGRNGKSVVSEAITGVFGDSLVSNYSPEQLFKSSQSTYNLADINGKLANCADDVSNKDFSGGDFKQFISGAKFQARHIYGRPFTVTKVPLMLCCVNEVPPTTDDTMGHYRRLLPIMCPNQIADKDVDVALPKKLATEEAKSAIFNWIYEGYLKLVENNGKIQISDSIVEMKEGIKEEGNSARRWIAESGFVAVKPIGDWDDRWKSMKEWMQMYIAYCKDYSEQPKTSKSVGKIFREMGFECQKRRDSTWFCIGVKEQMPEVKGVFEGDGVKEDLPF